MNGYNTLSAVVSYFKGNSRKVRTVTNVVIKIGPFDVATATLGGRYSQADALAEFRKNPNRFQRKEGFDAAKGLGLVA